MLRVRQSDVFASYLAGGRGRGALHAPDAAQDRAALPAGGEGRPERVSVPEEVLPSRAGVRAFLSLQEHTLQSPQPLFKDSEPRFYDPSSCEQYSQFRSCDAHSFAAEENRNRGSASDATGGLGLVGS